MSTGSFARLKYLVALCQQCHKVRHGLSNWQREHYKDWKRRMGYVEVQEWGPGVVFVYGHGYWKFAEPAGSIVSIGSPRGAALIAQGIAVLAEPPPDIESSARNR